MRILDGFALAENDGFAADFDDLFFGNEGENFGDRKSRLATQNKCVEFAFDSHVGVLRNFWAAGLRPNAAEPALFYCFWGRK